MGVPLFYKSLSYEPSTYVNIEKKSSIFGGESNKVDVFVKGRHKFKFDISPLYIDDTKNFYKYLFSLLEYSPWQDVEEFSFERVERFSQSMVFREFIKFYNGGEKLDFTKTNKGWIIKSIYQYTPSPYTPVSKEIENELKKQEFILEAKGDKGYFKLYAYLTNHKVKDIDVKLHRDECEFILASLIEGHKRSLYHFDKNIKYPNICDTSNMKYKDYEMLDQLSFTKDDVLNKLRP